MQCAWAASRKKNSYFEAPFLKSRSGPKKAAIAVAASILTTAYHMLADDEEAMIIAHAAAPATTTSATITSLVAPARVAQKLAGRYDWKRQL